MVRVEDGSLGFLAEVSNQTPETICKHANMASVVVVHPFPHDSANRYEAVGRFIAQVVIIERALDLILVAQPQHQPRELIRMKLARKIELISELIRDPALDLGDFDDLPGKLTTVKGSRNLFAHRMLARGPIAHFTQGLPYESISKDEQHQQEAEAVEAYEVCRLLHQRLILDPLNPGMHTERPRATDVTSV